MPCCGESYVVNDDFESPSRGRKTDGSFISIVKFMLLAVLLFAVIYCLIAFLAIREEKDEPSLASQSRSTESTLTFNENYAETVVTEDSKSSESEPRLASESRSAQSTLTFNENHTETVVTEDPKPSQSEPSLASQSRSTQSTLTFNENHAGIVVTEDPKPSESEASLASQSRSTQSTLTFNENHTGIVVTEDPKPSESEPSLPSQSRSTQSTLTFNENHAETVVTEDRKSSESEPSLSSQSRSTQSISTLDENHTETIVTENSKSNSEFSPAPQSNSTQSTLILNQIYTETVVTEDLKSTEFLKSIFEKISTIAFTKSSGNTTQTTPPETSHSTIVLDGTTLPNELFNFIHKERSNLLNDFTRDESTTISSNNKNLADILQEDRKASLCQSAQCKTKAVEMLQLIDHSKDLCEDFYEFACGAASEPEDEWTDILLEAVYVARNNKKLHTFQYLLNNTDRFTSYNSIPLSFTSLPVYVLPHFTIQYGFVGEQEGYGLQILPSTMPEFSMDTISCTYIGNNSNDLSTIFEEYHECKTANRIRQIFYFMDIYHEKNISYKDDFDSAVIFKKPKVTSIDVQNAVLGAEYTKFTIRKLTERYTVIDWKSLFRQLADKDLSLSTPVYLYFESNYFSNLMDNLKTNEKIQKTFTSYANMLFHLNVLKRFNDRRLVVRQVADMMPQTAKNLIADLLKLPQFDMQILEELKNKFYWLIESSRLEEVVKEMIKGKLKALKFYFHQREDTRKDCRRLSLVTDECLFNTEPHWNQKYPEFNRYNKSIYIPLRFLYKYSKLKEQPPYIAEAYLTFHLSRAIALYLDSFARNLQSTLFTQFLKTLNNYLINEENKLSWKGRTITYTLSKDVIDLTTSDRLADNLALQIAFSSTFPTNVSSPLLPWISADYTAEQQFFIAIAQDYCGSSRSHLIASAQDLYEKGRLPHQLRIETLMSKSYEFEKTFKCPRGSRMNPEDKIEFDSFTPVDEYYQAYEEQINK